MLSLVILALLGVGAGCGSDDDDSASGGADSGGKEVITVAQYQDPGTATYKNGKLEGIDGEILTEVADRLGFDLKVETMDAAAVIPAVQQGRADVGIGQWADTPERRETMALSNVHPWYSFIDLTQIGGCEHTKLAEYQEGLKLGTTTGFTIGEAYEKAFPGINLRYYPNSDSGLQDLLAGRLDAFTFGSVAAIYAQQARPDADLAVCYIDPADQKALEDVGGRPAPKISFLFSKENSELRDRVDKEIAKLRKDGTVEEILRKYLPEEHVQFALTGKAQE